MNTAQKKPGRPRKNTNPTNLNIKEVLAGRQSLYVGEGETAGRIKPEYLEAAEQPPLTLKSKHPHRDYNGQEIKAGDFVVLLGTKGASVAHVINPGAAKDTIYVEWANGNAAIWNNTSQTACVLPEGFITTGDE